MSLICSNVALAPYCVQVKRPFLPAPLPLHTPLSSALGPTLVLRHAGHFPVSGLPHGCPFCSVSSSYPKGFLHSFMWGFCAKNLSDSSFKNGDFPFYPKLPPSAYTALIALSLCASYLVSETGSLLHSTQSSPFWEGQ